MNPQFENRLLRIQRISSTARGICTALIWAVLVAAVVAAVSAIAGRLDSVNSFGLSITIADLGLGGRLVIALVSLAAGAVLAKALYHLRCLSGNYARREVFTAESARQIRQFGISCMLWGGVKLVWAFLPMMLMSASTPLANLAVDTLLIGAVIVGISWFAEMAATLREENDLTI